MAIAFDLPIDTYEHRRLAETAWIACLLALIANPDLTNSELAAAAGTTEKQGVRMADIFVLRKIRRLAASPEA